MTENNRYVCIHGHFYQPPRENPWLEKVELQDSAFPYHDWNDRISEECYGPNAVARIIGGEGRIVDIINNYSRISFNFGPTLLSWMEENKPAIYKAVLEADEQSQMRFNGHGAALAQVYNHVIMPLANLRDKKTQVKWGVADFRRRFKRDPEGMWLAETAVDTETLEVLAEEKIKFTILSPYQAKSVRKIGEEDWTATEGGAVDTRRPYLCRLPSGRSITLFFYNGPVSQEVAFAGLLKSGEYFANRLLSLLDEAPEQPQLGHIATDGETYGHHHRNGEMALSYGLRHIEEGDSARITIYPEFLAENPPEWEAQIIEDSSWSCSHGVERWRSNCGCQTGGRPGWNQEWRSGIRKALDYLRDELEVQYVKSVQPFVDDPWTARDGYIDVILDRSPPSIEAFVSKHCRNQLNQSELKSLLELLEMQRQLLLMYTSCGWFFDEVSGIETVQVLQYAGRALQLAKTFSSSTDTEEEFIKILETAESNLPEYHNAGWLYTNWILPAAVDLERVAAHFAVSALFEEYPKKAEIGCYEIERRKWKLNETGRERLIFGTVNILSIITREEKTLAFTVLHMGDHNFMGGITPAENDVEHDEDQELLEELFLRGDIPGMIIKLDKKYRKNSYLLQNLFKDEQRKIVSELMSITYEDLEVSYRRIFRNNYPLLHLLKSTKQPIPKSLLTPIEFILNNDIRSVFEQEEINFDALDVALAEIKRWGFELEKENLSFIISKKITALVQEAVESGINEKYYKIINDVFSRIDFLNLDLDLYHAQNVYFGYLSSLNGEQRPLHQPELLERVNDLCDLLGILSYKELAYEEQVDYT